MNLQALRQTLLDQVQDSWKETIRLRYRILENGVERTVHLPDQNQEEPGLWWNLCLSTDHGDETSPTPRSFEMWEILEIVVSPPLGLRAVERVREIFKTKWALERQAVEWMVGQQSSPGGKRSPQLCVLRPRFAEKRSANEPARLPVAAWQDPEADLFRIQWDPHQLVHVTQGLRSSFELAPYDELLRRLEANSDQPERSVKTIELLRFWAHALNERELANDDEGTPYESELSTRAAKWLDSLGVADPDVDRWLDDVRAVEDRLCRPLILHGSTLSENDAISGNDVPTDLLPASDSDQEDASEAHGEVDAVMVPEDSREVATHAVETLESVAREGREMTMAGSADAPPPEYDDEGEDGRLDGLHEGPLDRGATPVEEPAGQVEEHERDSETAAPSTAELESEEDEEPVFELAPQPARASSNGTGITYEPAGERVEVSSEGDTPLETAGESISTANDVGSRADVGPAIDEVRSDYRELDLPRKMRLEGLGATLFAGRDQDACEGKILGLFDTDGKRVDLVEKGREAWLLASRTCCAGFGDGFASDQGWIYNSVGAAEVQAVQRTETHLVHLIQVTRGRFRVGEEVDILVEERRRRALERNATAAQATWAAWLDSHPGWNLRAHQIAPHGFTLELAHSEGLAIDDAGLHLIEDRLASWVLDSEWIDTLDHAGMGTAVFGPSGGFQSGPDRCPLAFGSLGNVDGGWIACRQSSELGLVRLTAEEVGASWRIVGVTGHVAASALLESARRLTTQARANGSGPSNGHCDNSGRDGESNGHDRVENGAVVTSSAH